MARPIPTDPEAVPSLDLIDEELRAGLPSEKTRLDQAWTNEEVYQGRAEQFLERREAEDDESFRARPKRYSRLLRGVLSKLAEPVYDPGPTRELAGNPGLSEWLSDVAADCHLNSLMAEADIASLNNDVAAIQVEATGEPDRPIRLMLWKAHELAVYCRDGDPACPWAVVTRDVIPAGLGKVRTRYRAWTATERRTYVTIPFDDNSASTGGRRADIRVPEESGPSSYPGVLPFAFVRATPATTCRTFWQGGIGSLLCAVNLDLDRSLSDLAQHIQQFLNPKAFARNVAVGSRFFDRVGHFIQLKSTTAARQGDSNAEPDVFYLQAQLAVQDAWHDIEQYANRSLEELGIPLSVVHTDSSTDLSGVAIIAKTWLPLSKRTRRRQLLLAESETDLAATILAVAGAWYGQSAFSAAASDPELLLTWPEPQIPLPAPERDAADQTELELGLTDPLEVLARRRGITIPQAVELAEQIAERRKQWNQIMGMPEDQTLGTPTPPQPEQPEADDTGDAEPDPKDADEPKETEADQ